MVANRRRTISLRDFGLQLHHWRHRDRYRRLRAKGGPYTFHGFDRLRCVFVHVPKTGGVSINRALFGNLGGGHRTITDYKKIYGPLALSSYFTFAFVRNPLHRLRSAFDYLSVGGMGPSDRAWTEEHWDGVETLEDMVMGWLDSDTMWSGLHFQPQTHYVCDSRGKVAVDFVGHFERIDSDFARVCERIGVSRTLGRENVGPAQRRAPSTYTAEMRQRVAVLYARDFEVFGYSPDD